MEVETGTEALQAVWQYLPKLNTCILSNSAPQYVPDKNAYTCSPKDVYRNVHGRTLGEQQKLETTGMNVHDWGASTPWNTTEQREWTNYSYLHTTT